MKTIEVKGFWGILAFVIAMLVTVALLLLVPSLVVWVSWNALVGEMMHGPMFSFIQAVLFTAILFVLNQIVFRPQWNLELRKTDSPGSGKK